LWIEKPPTQSQSAIGNQQSAMYVVGLMSGTSADGIDAVLMRIENAPPTLDWKLIAHVNIPYEESLRKDIFACFRPETGTVEHICKVNFALGRALANAALRVIESAKMKPEQIDLIGSHGQTVWHVPTGEAASTLQIGEAAVIAEMTGIDVINNFRTRDMAAGGQGAPLVAYVDQLLLTHSTLTRAAQNIGGVANVTYVPSQSSIPNLQSLKINDQRLGFAFDTGPGNMLIDDAVTRATNGKQTFDRNGDLASRGKVDGMLLSELMEEDYLYQMPPKTTGRELFGVQFGAEAWKKAKARNVSDEDIVATMTAFTARSIAQAYKDFLPAMPDEVIVSGGGARNTTLMKMLGEYLAPARVFTSDEIGVAVEAREAVAFAVLAYESFHGRRGNLPAATGARREVVLGSLTKGR
jgi:anhydro-N-acetylmuramic acid kinase